MVDEPWLRLAELVRRRREQRHLSQRQVAVAAGTTDRLISSIERAERTTYKPQNLSAVAVALGWTPDSAERILRGEPPVDDTHEPVDPHEARLDKLERELAALRAELGLPPRQRNGTETRSA